MSEANNQNKETTGGDAPRADAPKADASAGDTKDWKQEFEILKADFEKTQATLKEVIEQRQQLKSENNTLKLGKQDLNSIKIEGIEDIAKASKEALAFEISKARQERDSYQAKLKEYDDKALQAHRETALDAALKKKGFNTERLEVFKKKFVSYQEMGVDSLTPEQALYKAEQYVDGLRKDFPEFFQVEGKAKVNPPDNLKTSTPETVGPFKNYSVLQEEIAKAHKEKNTARLIALVGHRKEVYGH